ncbi:type II restriction endonuclease [Streptococcus cuniculipharyngis]|uniref:Type-2 restriction enzyme n=1 Tax=Streptococcus cuniculipharyngis TaxID=1562651 RepID=A0A5C5SFS3_9STRE|nr:type II restriction endonuclease [Streptococcus cuniculipharyngis]TWS98751.1 restriction endonuclease [Streptococcus cuniculipharyngis]
MELSKYISLSADERLNFFLSTLSITNRTPEYYVNWEKVERETKKFELELNTLNYLIGKMDIYHEALKLFEKQPDLLKAIPSLIASRDKILDILTIDENDNMSFEQLNFSTIDTTRIVDYVDFSEQAGLLDFLQNKANRSLVDYVYGVEAGLDSNARKNRSGSTMEGILERHVAKICQECNLEFKPQATAPYILDTWGITVPVDKSERRFDIAVYSKENNKLWLIETNYYGGGGSKLKAVAGEFTELSQFVRSSDDNVEFIWVTDGQGWKTAHLPLLEAFGHINKVFNLDMLRKDYLYQLFIE